MSTVETRPAVQRRPARPELRLPSMESVFPALLLILATTLLVLLIRPFAGSFFTAVLLSCLFAPWQKKLTALLGGRTYLAAGLLTAGAVFAILLPTSWLAYAAGREVVRANDWVAETVEREGWSGVTEPLPDVLEPSASWAVSRIPSEWRDAWVGSPRDPWRSRWWSLGYLEALPAVAAAADGDPAPAQADEAPASAGDGTEEGSEAGSTEGSAEGDSSQSADESSALESLDATTLSATASFASSLVGGFVSWLVAASMAVAALYFLLSEGERLLDYLLRLVPMRRERSVQFVDEFRRVSTAVFKATIVSAILQTLVAVTAYLVLGLPSPIVLGLLTMAGALIPIVGAGTVCAAIGLGVALSGSTLEGVGLIAWGVVAVGLLDNVTKPLLASGESRQPSSLVFFSMVCGLVVFGLMGLFAGPLILAFFVVSVRLARDGSKGGRDGSPSAGEVTPEPAA